MHLAIVGIRGIPNNYGGFETLAEYLVENLIDDFVITVYCSSKDMNSKLTMYKGAKLKYIPVSSHGAQGILYDSLALLDAAKTADKILLLGFGGGYAIPFLSSKSKSKIILNIGGLDWKRNKWSPFAKRIIKISEMLLMRNAGAIISDNVGIQKYILKYYHRTSTFIPYGGDQVVKQEIDEKAKSDFKFLSKKYAFAVARIQPDNNIEMIIEAFSKHSRLPLVIVGNWNQSPYGVDLRKKYDGKENLILLDAIYDRCKLDLLRSNCTLYVHGHSAGGTNPSLVEAMHLALPIFAFASGYNEHTTLNKARYFENSEQLAYLVNHCNIYELHNMGSNLKELAQRVYVWKDISNEYKSLILSKSASNPQIEDYESAVLAEA
ncbi:MAG TPA: DUF1972 domain-containing protein [Mucilaginibacter sp.]|nr:DUF1972 domain-containing protein [Mucilaginibacter sp.]